jgi:hypothetical protein
VGSGTGSSESSVGVAVGVVVAVLAVTGAAVVGLVFVMKTHKLKFRDLSVAKVVAAVKTFKRGDRVAKIIAAEVTSTSTKSASEVGVIAVVASVSRSEHVWLLLLLLLH